MHPRGTILLEALLAAGVAAMFMTAIVSMVIVSNQTSDRAGKYELASWYAFEGVEALQTMAFADLSNTETGGITFANATWSIAGGAQTLAQSMTRAVHIRDVYRDASCDIVTNGGTVDLDSKYLVSNVTWTDARGQAHTVTEETLRTRWDNPQGTCFAAQQASQVTFSFTNAQFSGGKQLRQVYMTNTGTTAAVIDKVTFTWNYATELDQLFIDTSKVWSESGPGTPTDDVESGTELNVADFTINAGATVEINKGQFSGPMTGATITISVIYIDGSIYTSPPITPY